MAPILQKWEVVHRDGERIVVGYERVVEAVTVLREATAVAPAMKRSPPVSVTLVWSMAG